MYMQHTMPGFPYFLHLFVVQIYIMDNKIQNVSKLKSGRMLWSGSYQLAVLELYLSSIHFFSISSSFWLFFSVYTVSSFTLSHPEYLLLSILFSSFRHSSAFPSWMGMSCSIPLVVFKPNLLCFLQEWAPVVCISRNTLFGFFLSHPYRQTDNTRFCRHIFKVGHTWSGCKSIIYRYI